MLNADIMLARIVLFLKRCERERPSFALLQVFHERVLHHVGQRRGNLLALRVGVESGLKVIWYGDGRSFHVHILSSIER